MAVHHLEVTTENLLNAVAQMPESEFNRFVEKAKKLRHKEQKISPKEADLLHKINTVYSAEKRQRYNELYAKFKNDDIEKDENEELLELSNEFEMLNAKRLNYIGKLAELRGQSLEQTMDFFEIKNSRSE